MIKLKSNDTEILNNGKEVLKIALSLIEEKEYAKAKEMFTDAQQVFSRCNCTEYISICLSFIGLTDFLIDRNNYKQALSLINDGAHMARFSKSGLAKAVNEFSLGNINYGERNNDVALIHYTNVINTRLDEDWLNIKARTTLRIKQLQSGLDFSLPIKSDPLVSLVKIGRSITALTDIDVLLDVIANETTSAIQADRCTVFILDKEKNELWSKIALGMDSEEIRFPADLGLAGSVVKTGEPVNIADAYNDERFNKDVDMKTGYHTKTVLCMPIRNNNQEIVGVFQVLNKLNGCFTKSDEDLLAAIGGSAGIALENASLFEQQKELYREQKELFESFIDTLATSIDARDKITAGHSSRVKLYAMLLVDELGLDVKRKELIEKAATLHDIGKIGIRDSVLQKEGKLTDEEYRHIQEHVKITHNILEKIHMSDDFKTITEIACSHHEKWDGSGYYRKLAGENIPYGGRILAVADVFDAITSKRHYRDKMPIENVIQILINDSGKHFDGALTDKFLQVTLDKLVGVFLTENPDVISLKDKDKEILSHYNLMDIYNFINNSEHDEIIALFNSYYNGGK
ncbi:MAG: GAF domain-containing protein [Heliobacteriaceae bacterium]|jgi:HD-GYP domain-containing protein (c-di-GMP phosphodiesterase class II)|nr:GAF domain-containing protein [Heliobacteriaceae bacterium]